MRVTKFIHSCLLVEQGDERLLFDPGKFSFIEGKVKPEQFTGITAILITHSHPDHADADALKRIVAGNPTAVVLTNSETRKKLAEAGIQAEVFETGKRGLGHFRLEAFDAPHAAILGSDPPQNTAYLVDEVLLNPGDSYSENITRFAGVPVLVLPVMAPWTTELGTADFAVRIRPRHAIPVHDGYSKEFFLKQRYDVFEKQFSEQNIRLERMMEPGSFFEHEFHSSS